MKITGTITFTEAEICNAIALELARKLGIGVPLLDVELKLDGPVCAGAAASIEAIVHVDGAAVKVE